MSMSQRYSWLVFLAEVAVGMFFAFIFSITGLLIGMTIGGNFFSIPYAGLQGYESMGLLGTLIGGWVGPLIGCWLIAYRYDLANYAWRSLVYPATIGFFIMLIFSSNGELWGSSNGFVIWGLLVFFPALTLSIARRVWQMNPYARRAGQRTH